MLKSLRIALLTVGALFAVCAIAQPAYDDAPSGSAEQDPPSRVGRLSFIRGAVSFVPAGENDWVEAQLNRPLITGDKLWTDRGSRAELEIGPATIRIDEQTSFDFLNLDDDTAQIELTEGALNVHVRRLYDNQVYEVDTPTLAFVINRVGEYRVSVEPDGRATIVSVMQGGGDAYGEDGARFRVEEGQSVTFNDSTLRDYYTDAIPPPDDFDGFVQERDSRWERSRSREYVSEDVIGYSDLDDYGDWDDVPEYGHVWYPTSVSVGWTPYHNGHWGWVGSYGWTWIDDAPWGFAPFHYGRWAYVGNRWGWCPGPRSVRPYYAPALVAFIGGGVSVGVSLGGPVGWFPLGPRDVYFPGYRVSQRYFTRVNVSNTIVNTTVINNYYGNYSRNNVDYSRIAFANRNISGAVTAVPATAFVSARPVAQAAVAVNRTTFANARVSSYAAVAPTRASLVAATARQATARPPQAVMERRIVAASRPAAPIAPFATREAMLKKNPGQPLDRAQLRARPAELPARGGANVANTPNANARGAGLGDRGNVKVVTNAGAPVRTAAPVLTARPRAEGDNRGRRAGPGVPQGNGNAPANAANAANEAAQRGASDRRGNADRAVGNERQPGNPNQGQGNQGQQRLRSSDFVRGNRGNAPEGNAANPQQAQPPQQQVERGREANADRGRGRDVNGAPADVSRGAQGQDRAREAQMQQQNQQREQMQRQREAQQQQREQAQQQNVQREAQQNQREQMQRQRDQQVQQQREQAQQQNAQREAQQQQQQQNQQREQMQRQREAQQQREQAQQQQNQQREQMQRQREAQQQQQQQREQAQQQREQQMQQQREQMQRQREAQQQQQQQREQAQRQPPPQRQQQAPPPQNQGNRGDNRSKEDKKKKDDNGGG